MFKSSVKQRNHFRYLARERNALFDMDHPFIIKLHSVWEDPYAYYFCMDFMPKGDMFDRFAKYGALRLDNVRFYTAELVEALAYLRDKGYVHRDIKMENILLDFNYHIKLSDFGTCKRVGQPGGATPAAIDYNSYSGTEEFMAPEVWDKAPVTFSTDLWNLGCVIYQLAVGRIVFSDNPSDTLVHRIKNLVYTFPRYIDPVVQDLVEKLLVVDPRARLGADDISQVKGHAFYTGVDWVNLHRLRLPSITPRDTPSGEPSADWGDVASPPPSEVD